MMILTFWEDPPHKGDPEDYDELFHVRPKSMKDVPHWVAAKPDRCTMISVERSSDAKKNGKVSNPHNSRYFRVVWKAGEAAPSQRPPVCPMCGRPHPTQEEPS